MNKWALYYPRPRLKRNSFFSLDGKWLLNGNEIEIPFPRESSLSKYNGTFEDNLLYTKEFTLPSNFYNYSDRIILHFGAIDQIANIYLNNDFLIKHEGGYLPFEIDITDSLAKINTLRIEVKDSLDHYYPYGKQTREPHGMWYTQISGIWQSVWIEAVPRFYIKDVSIKTEIDKLVIDIDSNDFAFFVDIPLNNKKHFKQYYESKHIEINYEELGGNLHYWSTDDPYLYSIFISTKSDNIESYFGIKRIQIKQVGKYKRLFINDKPLLIKGVLDQGYFQDGIYLPEDPQEYFNDILRMKELGFNTLRKHIKVEPEVFYYACDKLGMLVMQDFVNSGNFYSLFHAIIPNIIPLKINDKLFINKERLNFFINHSKEIIKKVDSHPSVFAYTIYNEGWGQQDSDNVYSIVKELAKDKLFDSTSGWFKQSKSDFDSYHIYFRNKKLKAKKDKVLLISECGGYKRSIENHLYKTNVEYGYGKTDSEEELTGRYHKLFNKMINPSIINGLCGYIITQLSDVETEINGFYTYDRLIAKINKKELFDLNDKSQKIYINEITNNN